MCLYTLLLSFEVSLTPTDQLQNADQAIQGTDTLSIKLAQKPHILGLFGSTSLKKDESFEGKG